MAEAGMTAARVVLAIAGAALLSVAGCGKSDKQPHLMNIRSETAGPDEFSIVPPKPLAMPEDQHPHTGSMYYETGIAKIPAGALSTKSSNLLAEAIQKGKTQLIFEMD